MLHAHNSLKRVIFSCRSTDRLYTDKVMAENAGIDFILVLSGESTREDLAMLERWPAMVLEGLGGLR